MNTLTLGTSAHTTNPFLVFLGGMFCGVACMIGTPYVLDHIDHHTATENAIKSEKRALAMEKAIERGEYVRVDVVQMADTPAP